MAASFLRPERGDEDWSVRFREQLNKLAQLPTGTDGWRPHQPSPDVLATAQKIGEDAGHRGLFVSVVTATSEGGVQLKWQDRHREFSFLVYRDRTVEYLFVYRERNIRRSGELRNARQAGQLLAEFLK
jgi:hypothetical protein